MLFACFLGIGYLDIKKSSWRRLRQKLTHMMSKNESWPALFLLITHSMGAKLMKFHLEFWLIIFSTLTHLIFIENLNAISYFLLVLKYCYKVNWSWEIILFKVKHLNWATHHVFSQIPNPEIRTFASFRLFWWTRLILICKIKSRTRDCEFVKPFGKQLSHYKFPS